MSYAKVWRSLWDGTMCGRPTLQLVWIFLLSHADAKGHVEMSFRAIAAPTGLSIEEVCNAIRELESPEPDSRSHEEDGRRLVRLYEHRDWGWRIVNFAKYRSYRNDDERRADFYDPKYLPRERRTTVEKGYIYFARSGDGRSIKIGYSRNPWSRVNEMRTVRPDISLVHVVAGTLQEEKALHKRFSELRIGREWFHYDGELRNHVALLVANSSNDESPKTEDRGQTEPSLPVATLREGAPFGRAISSEISRTQNLKESFPGTTADYAGAGNDATQGPPASASGGWGAAAGPCDASAARIGTPDAQEGTEDRAGSRDGAEAESEAKPRAERDPRANAEVREYVGPVYEIAKPYGAAIATKTLALCGRLYNAGRRSTMFLQTVARHYVEHRGEIREPEAFYSGKTVGSEGLLMDLAAQSVIAEHQRQAAETGAWLKGSRP